MVLFQNRLTRLPDGNHFIRIRQVAQFGQRRKDLNLAA
jgi:hypothetical protein